MKATQILLIVLLIAGCRAKYDISKAVEILPSTEVEQVDYTLNDDNITVDNGSNVVNLSDGNLQGVASFDFVPKSGIYNNGFVYALGSKHIAAFDISQNAMQTVLHSVVKPMDIFVTNSFLMVYNAKKFAIFDAITLEKLWEGELKIDDLASKFVCVEDSKSCFALAISGEIIEMNLAERYVKNLPVAQKQETLLNTLYVPAIAQNYLIFVTSNTEFAIFDWQTKKVVTHAPFVDTDSASIFDINLVQSVSTNGDKVLISHTNGLYAFSMLYGKPLWAKNIITSGAVAFLGEYVVAYDKNAKKIIVIHIEKGGIKWSEELKDAPMNIFVDYTKQLVVLGNDGFHLFDINTGEKAENKNYKFNASGVVYAFSHNDTLYYLNNRKIFAVK
jgi:hypothetical protein